MRNQAVVLEAYRPIGHLLATARFKKNLGREQVAKAIELADVSKLMEWENGRSLPRLSLLKKLVELYEIPIEHMTDVLVGCEERVLAATGL